MFLFLQESQAGDVLETVLFREETRAIWAIYLRALMGVDRRACVTVQGALSLDKMETDLKMPWDAMQGIISSIRDLSKVDRGRTCTKMAQASADRGIVALLVGLQGSRYILIQKTACYAVLKAELNTYSEVPGVGSKG